MSATSATLFSCEFDVSADAVLEFDYPLLSEGCGICIALAIDWRYQEKLHAYASRQTLPDDHARAARFRRSEDRLRHLLGRMLLRRAAIHYGGMGPAQAIGTNKWGKPEPTACSVGCNVSHAGDLVLLAVSSHAQVGIDAEEINATQDFRHVVPAFHPDEIAALEKMKNDTRAVMRCWSRKEAVSKATGMGLSLPLRSYAVDCGTQPAAWLRSAPPGTSRDTWTTHDIPMGENYAGALAIYGRCERITLMRLNLVE